MDAGAPAAGVSVMQPGQGGYGTAPQYQTQPMASPLTPGANQ
jgi:hypothetical protein